MAEKKVLRIIHFQDPNDGTIQQDAVGFSKHSEYDLQQIAEKIVKEFEEQGFEDWAYDDIYQALIERGIIEPPDFEVDWVEILL